MSYSTLRRSFLHTLGASIALGFSRWAHASFLCCQLFLATAVGAGDWPTYQHDAAQSGVSSESLATPLHERWVHVADHPPRPAWPAPAKQDFWHNLMNLASADVLYVPTGRTSPAAFSRRDGSKDKAELQDQIKALDQSRLGLEERRRDCIKWREEHRLPYSLVLDGDLLFAGGENRVVAIGAANGVELWEAEVDGNAHGICVANGCLFVTTDQGSIHCFSQTDAERPHVVRTIGVPYAESAAAAVYAEAARELMRGKTESVRN